MSYIVAFLSYGSKQAYTANCYRTDIKVGDRVIVRRHDNALRQATVTDLQFLNWDCKSRIECLVSEAAFDGKLVLPEPPRVVSGLATVERVWEHLKSTGWMKMPTMSRHYKAAFSYFNQHDWSNLYFRSNGIDLQIIKGRDNEALTETMRLSFFVRPHFQTVRHSLSHSDDNLFELTADFADKFRNRADDYSHYMIPQGDSDKRTQELKNNRYAKEPEMDLYDVLDGDGENDAYLGDGVYLTPGGGWRN